MLIELVVEIGVSGILVEVLAGEGLYLFDKRCELEDYFLLQLGTELEMLLLDAGVDGGHFLPGTLTLQLGDVPEQQLLQRL